VCVTGEVVAVPEGQRFVRILLADEQSLFREAVRVALDTEADMQVVAVAADGFHAVTEAERVRPDVAMLQADLPHCDAATATRLIKASVPECDVLVLTAVEDHRVLAAVLEAGACGYLSKNTPLGAAVLSARRGEMLISPRLRGAVFAELVRHRREQDAAADRIAQLTRREREVLGLLAEGAGNDAVARALLISP
jgi:DNA-binding NarL/FixJ family response regulator